MRQIIFSLTDIQCLESALRQPCSSEISSVISDARHMMNKCPHGATQLVVSHTFNALSSGFYPVFQNYPRYVTDFYVNEKTRITSEHHNLEIERQDLKTVGEYSRKLEFDAAAHRHRVAHLETIENLRRQDVLFHEKELENERRRVRTTARKHREDIIKLTDAMQLEHIKELEKIKNIELQRAEDDLQRQHSRRKEELAALEMDENLRYSELCSLKRLEILKLEKQREGIRNSIRTAFSIREKQEDIQLDYLKSQWQEEDAQRASDLREHVEQRQIQEAAQAEAAILAEITEQMRLARLETDLEVEKISRLRQRRLTVDESRKNCQIAEKRQESKLENVNPRPNIINEDSINRINVAIDPNNNHDVISNDSTSVSGTSLIPASPAKSNTPQGTPDVILSESQQHNILLSLLEQGVHIVTNAVEHDKNEQYDISFDLYCQALKCFVGALQYERNPYTRSKLHEKVLEYLHRAEELRQFLVDSNI